MISIIIPTYNREMIISRALNSILEQTYGDWECVVVDDGSTDDTEKVIREYIDQNSRFQYLRNNRSKGAQGARNTGILAAQGEWVILFDSDNKMHPSFLASLKEEQEKWNVDVCSTWSNIVNDEDGNIVGSFNWTGYGNVHSNLLTGKSYFDNSSTMIRRQLLLDVGLLDETCPAFQEWDTHIRISNLGTYTTIKENLVDYYTGLSDSISASKSKDVKGYLFILSKYKSEWRRDFYGSFLKYGAILKMKMVRIDCNDEMKQRYKDLYTAGERCLIYVLSGIYRTKQSIGKNKF